MGRISQDAVFLKAFGRRLRALRREKGMSQLQLARLSKISPRFIIYMEKGERNLTLLVLKDLAKGLETSPRGLLPF